MRVIAVLLMVSAAVSSMLACGGESRSPAQTAQPTATVARSLIQSLVTPTFRPAGDDRLQIPRIGLDTALVLKPVSASGTAPEADTPDDAVLYDFSSFTAQTGFGGLPGTGNAVISGQLDSGSRPCRGGFSLPPCTGVFWELKRLSRGEAVTIVWKQQTYVYRVVSLCWIERTSRSFDRVFARTDSESLTLLTSAGRFDADAKSYSHFLYVRAELKPDSLAQDCPAGSTPPPAEPTPTPSAPADVEVRALPAAISTGQEVSLSASTVAGKSCKMVVATPDGSPLVEASNIRANQEGVIDYKWTMPATVRPGAYIVEISCGARPVQRELAVR